MQSPAKVTTNCGAEMTLLSSVAVQGTMYNLVASTPKSSTADSSARPSTSKGSPKKPQQRARKTFPTAQGTFRMPEAIAEKGTSSPMNAREKQMVPDQTKNSQPSANPSNKSSESTTGKASKEIPALIPIIEELQSPAKKQRLDVSISEQSTVLDEPIERPPRDPVFAEMAALMGENLEDDVVSSTVRPMISSPTVQTVSSSDSGREAAPKSNKEYPPTKTVVQSPKSSPMATTSVPPAAMNKRTRTSRELENLYIDEGAGRILSEMATRGTNRRPTKNPNVALNAPPSAPARSSPKTRMSREVKKNVTKKKTSPMTIGGKEIEGKGHLDQWKAVKTSDPDGSTVYVPRQILPGAPKFVKNRGYPLSDSSTEDEAVFRQKQQQKPVRMIPAAVASSSSTSPLVPSPRRVLSSPKESPVRPVNDREYTRVSQQPSTVGVASNATGGGVVSTYSSTEIKIRQVDRHLLHLTLNRKPNSLSVNVLKELTVLLRQLKGEKDVHVVLITSSGPDFCTGIDISSLIDDSMSVRKESARNLSNVIQEFIMELANCDKILVGGVNGAAVGLGVTMLRHFDVVFSSDQSTFSLPYAKLAQGTEGGAAMVLHNSSTPNNLFGLMLYHGRRLNAEEAKTAGLVNEIIERSSFLDVLVLQVRSMAAQSSQAMLALKKNLRHGFRRKLPAILMNESKLLREHWPSEEFQRRAAAVLTADQLRL